MRSPFFQIGQERNVNGYDLRIQNYDDSTMGNIVETKNDLRMMNNAKILERNCQVWCNLKIIDSSVFESTWCCLLFAALNILIRKNKESLKLLNIILISSKLKFLNYKLFIHSFFQTDGITFSRISKYQRIPLKNTKSCQFIIEPWKFVIPFKEFKHAQCPILLIFMSNLRCKLDFLSIFCGFAHSFKTFIVSLGVESW